jgi:uncharacterized membrane protein
MTFATPAALILLVLLPYFAWLGRPRMAYRRRRDVSSLILRLLIVVLLVFTLAGAQITRAMEKLSVVFLVDASDSIDANARSQAEEYIRRAMATMTTDDRAGLVVFGQNALVERPLSTAKELAGLTSAPVRLNSNLAEALRLALAMFPADSARRIVVLSDGVETVGNAVQAAELSAATGVQIDYVPLRNQGGPEILVTDVRAPAKVNAQEQFDLGVTVRSQSATTATLTVLSGGNVVVQRNVELKAGTNNFVYTITVGQQGFSDFRVRVDPIGQDSFYQNNELSGFSEITGPSRVLLVSPDATEIAALLPALQSAGLAVDVIAPGNLPTGVAGIAGYKSVILANVSATQLTTQRMKILQTYVRDLGGGLVAIGGPNSYGVGGYFQTPLEETLPVEMRIKDQKRVPKLLMVYVIDRSGSMEFIGPSGVTNLELAKEAARRSVNFLFPQDRAGVLSFDSNPEWLVPIQTVVSRDNITALIGTLRPGGGTDIHAAVKRIVADVPSDPSTLKHVILLTDGGAEPADSVEQVRKLNADYGVTFTAIGVGDGVPSFMKDIAVAGKGTYYNLIDAQTIPQIFTAETVLATRSYIVENPFNAGQSANHPILDGISGLPQLTGYVATTAKDTATTILTAPGFNDPILASWQYGLGRAVAFTSDATSRWAKAWTSWDQYARFWAQAVRSTILEGVNSRLESRVEVREGRQYLIVEARDDQGSFLNGLNLQASVVDPKLAGQNVTLQQVAPGRYEVPLDPQQEGAYFIRIAGAGAQNQPGTVVGQTLGWVLSYSPEYQLRDTNIDLLNTLAEMTGGESLAERPELAFAHNLQTQSASLPLWPYLLLLAALLFPFDIAVRRLVVTQSDVQKLGAWARAKLPARPAPVPQPQSERISALKGAKERAAATIQTNTVPPPAINLPTETPRASLTTPDAPIQPQPPTKSEPSKPPQPGVSENSLASKLLSKKKGK